MKRRSFAKRRDANEPEIVAALEGIGATVIRLDPFDLLVGYQGRTHLIEVKTEKGRLKPAQEALIESWRGSPLHIVRTVDEALELVRAA